MSSNLIETKTYKLNPEANGGEAVLLTVSFFSDDVAVYTNEEFSLRSYSNSASINTIGVLRPKQLRTLADQIEADLNRLKQEIRK